MQSVIEAVNSFPRCFPGVGVGGRGRGGGVQTDRTALERSLVTVSMSEIKWCLSSVNQYHLV